jgi:hypothetical protein
MRNIIVALMVIVGFSGLTMAQEARVVAEDDHVAFFKSVSGDVKVVRGNSALVPVAGTQLFRLDVVSTGPNSSSGIVFKEGTLLTLGSSTEVEISRFVFQPEAEKYDFSLYMSKGEAIYSSGKLGKLAPGSINLKTPRAAVGVRGTRFIIKVDEKGTW